MDNAATIDRLGRRCVAQAFSQLLHEINRDQTLEFGKRLAQGRAKAEDFAFLANLHGRWGAGKSSVLNFLKEDLQDEKELKPWVVVELNAWQHQRLNVP